MRAPMAPSVPLLPVTHVREPEVSSELDAELRRLLRACFPQPHNAFFLERRYAHEVPLHRYLVRDTEGRLVAHLGIHDKLLGVGSGEVQVGGMAEVCVDETQRGRGLVKRLLDEAHRALAERGVPFAFLFGEPAIYGSSGYRHLAADVRRFDPAKGATETGPSRVAMYKPLTTQPWPEGVVDLRGPMF